jgi:hypothetical protein
MNEPAYLLSQQGLPSVPASETLDEAVLWDYSFAFYLRGDTDFEVIFNEERSIAYSMAFEDDGGVARIRVTASSGSLPVVLVHNTTPVFDDGTYRYRLPGGEFLMFADLDNIYSRTVIIKNLDVLAVQSARATLQGITFPAPLRPLIESSQHFDIGGKPGTITSHLTSLLQRLLGDTASAPPPIAFECRYRYSLNGLPIEVPVLLLPREAAGDGDEKLIAIEAAIRRWIDTTQPPADEASLIFALTFWSTMTEGAPPLLRLTNLALAITDIELPLVSTPP